MQLKKKPTAWWIAGGILFWQFVGQPLWNLNVERVAESAKIDTTLARFSPMTWLSEIASYLPSSFATGFAVGALIFAYWDTLLAWSRRRFRKGGELPDMRAWVGTISPTFEAGSGTLSLWFQVISVGDLPLRIAGVEGSVVIVCNDGNEKTAAYRLDNPAFEHSPTDEFAKRGFVVGFSILLQLPRQFQRLGSDVFWWKPTPSLELNDLTIWLESERRTKKKLQLWESMRLTSGDWQVRSVETHKIWKNDEEREKFQSAMGTFVKKFGAKL